MCYFSFQAELEDQLYSLQPSLFFNDVFTLKDRVDLSQKIIMHALYYVRRVPFWMLAVYCVDGLNVYYQMLQHIAQCVRDFSIRYICYTPATPLQQQCQSYHCVTLLLSAQWPADKSRKNI